MDEEKMDVRSDTQGFAAPILPENGGNLDADFAPKLPFAASGREMALAFFMYLPAYLYLQSAAWCFPVFCARRQPHCAHRMERERRGRSAGSL